MSCGCNSNNSTNLNPINYRPDNDYGSNGAVVKWINIVGIPGCIQDCDMLTNFIASTFTTMIPETDPTVPAHVKVITPTDISNWNTAFAFGPHVGLYVPITRAVNTGGGLTGGGSLGSDLTISHADTSSIGNLDASGAQVVDTMTFDTFGHVTGVTLRNLTPADIGAQPAGGSVTTPTLLQVTTSGATTNINTFFNSTVQVDRLNILASVGNIRSNSGLEIQAGVGNNLRLNAASGQNILFLNNNLLTNTIFSDGRVSGADAINPNEFVTLSQATGLAGGGSFIQNQSLSVQTASMRISGTGEFGGTVIGANATLANELINLGQADGRYMTVGNTQLRIIRTFADLPAPVAGVITLDNNCEYLFLGPINLGANRIVAGTNTSIRGIGAGPSSITATLSPGQALITSNSQLSIRTITLSTTGPGTQCIDYSGVGTEICVFQNVVFTGQKVGTFTTGNTIVFHQVAIVNATDGITLSGTFNSVIFDTFITANMVTGGTVINVTSTCTITNRLRVSWGELNVPIGTTGINVNTSAVIPVESYVLAYNIFTGSGTFTAGVTFSDNKSTWSENRGITNSITAGNFYMNNNATATVIAGTSTYVKAAGTTNAGSIIEKYSHSTGRLTYTGAVTRRIRVIVNLSAFVTGGSANTVAIRLAPNGVTDANTEVQVQLPGSSQPDSCVIQGIYTVNTNDFIEVWVANITSVNNITVRDIFCSIETLE